ncbi:MAG: VOC family protein [Sediminibacterium sp.]|jgi:catechol 2,3-dioxygenase-like lactoylglutathione lyase family enzyme|nr:VOC family protein [Chitinophagaceae bacterium]
MITGIQQIGIGVQDAYKASLLYRDDFGMKAKIFDDKASARLMTRYTGNEIHDRHAILSLNMAGGGGFEIWQYISRQPAMQPQDIKPGDAGIFAAKIKSQNIKEAYQYFKKSDCLYLSALYLTPDNRYQFWVKDRLNNWFTITETNNWFKKKQTHCGGVLGAVIGVTNMEKSLHFYKEILGVSEEVYNINGFANDIPGLLPDKKCHRVLLRKKAGKIGAFSELLGDIEIELIQVHGHHSKHIFANRYWGDCGFIHLCFDVHNMELFKKKAEAEGYTFTVDSKESFDMEDAAGRFCYVEDPDGTLIELVETHKVPILKKYGLYLNLKNRKKNTPLPAWMINLLGLSKVK